MTKAYFSYAIKEAKVNLNKVKELEEFFSDYYNTEVYGFYGVKLKTEKDNLIAIQVEDNFNKFHDSDLFADKLSQIITQGEVFLFFEDEEGSQWGFVVSPEEVKEMEKLWIDEDDRIINSQGEILGYLERINNRQENEKSPKR